MIKFMKKNYDILIIDDEQVIIDSVVKIAQADGLTVDSALDASIALDKIKNSVYKLFICDIMMPVMDGFKFLEEMEARGINTPIIMTTGFSTVENTVRALYHGAIGFIPKPFSFEELTSMIHRGMKYAAIQEKLRSDDPSSSEMIYVPCPSKYYRLGYSSWVSYEPDGAASVGVTDIYLKSIEIIKNIELLTQESTLIQGTPCAWFETEDDMRHHLMAPVSGKIIEVNPKIIENNSLVEKDPYFNGWLYKLIPNDLDYELKNLIPCSSDRY